MLPTLQRERAEKAYGMAGSLKLLCFIIETSLLLPERQACRPAGCWVTRRNESQFSEVHLLSSSKRWPSSCLIVALPAH